MSLVRPLKGHHDLGLITKPYLQKTYRMARHFILPYRFTPSTIADLKHPRHDTDRSKLIYAGSGVIIIEQADK